MTHHTYQEEKLFEVNSLRKRIIKDWAILISLATLVIVPLISILAVDATSRPDAPLGESGWFLNGLSTKSLLLMAVIWIVPLLLIIHSKWHEIGAEMDLLTKLKQHVTERFT